MAVNGDSPLRVVVVDDSEVVRAKLRGLFEQQGIVVAGEAEDGERGLELVAEQNPDVVVMDVRMPGMSGIEATWKLGTIAPETPVMMLTVSTEEEDVADAIMAGAKGYVVKGVRDEQIVITLRRVAAGERLVSPAIAAEIVEREYVARHEAREKLVHPPPSEVGEVTDAGEAARRAAATEDDPPPRRLAQPIFPDLTSEARASSGEQHAVPPGARAAAGEKPEGPGAVTASDWLATAAVALVAGALLTAIAFGEQITDGSADGETWVKAGLFVLVSFALLAMGLLARSGR